MNMEPDDRDDVIERVAMAKGAASPLQINRRIMKDAKSAKTKDATMHRQNPINRVW